MYSLVKLSLRHPTWKMDHLFYEKQFPVGNDGEKMSLMMFDSCLMICKALEGSPKEREEKLKYLDEDSLKLASTMCEDGWGDLAEEQSKFIEQTLQKGSADPSIIWKTTYDHHPLFGLGQDQKEIQEAILPLLR